MLTLNNSSLLLRVAQSEWFGLTAQDLMNSVFVDDEDKEQNKNFTIATRNIPWVHLLDSEMANV